MEQLHGSRLSNDQFVLNVEQTLKAKTP